MAPAPITNISTGKMKPHQMAAKSHNPITSNCRW